MPFQRALRLMWLTCLLWLPANAGYTHYFRSLQPPDKEPLRKCIAEMGRVVDARRAILAGEEGEGNPVISEDRLVFNVRADDSLEPFVFPGNTGPEKRWANREAGFNSSKTAGKPYDEVVRGRGDRLAADQAALVI